MKPTCLITLMLTLGSCATILNSPTQSVTVYTNEPAKISIDNKSSDSLTTMYSVKLHRDNAPVYIKAETNTQKKDFSVPAHRSWGHIANAVFFPGYFIDNKSSKKFGYPEYIRIDFDSKNEEYKLGKNVDDGKKNILKFTPLKILGLYNPSVEFGYERILSKTFGTQATASFLLPYSTMEILSKGSSSNYKGYRFGLEQRYYIKKRAPEGIYAAFETDCLKNKYQTVETFTLKNNPININGNYLGYADTLKVSKQFWSFNLKFGQQFIKRQFYFDMFVGIGLRIKKVQFSDKINPLDVMTNLHRHDAWSYFRNEGIVYAPSIPVNFKIGYRF